MVVNAFQALLMILIVIATGYFVAWKGWAGKSVTSFISKLIVNVTLPCTAVMAFLDKFTAQTILDAWIYIAVAFVAIAIVYVIGKLVARVAKIEKTRRGVFTTLFSFSNSVYIGLPVAAAIFGEDAIIFALFYYIANTVFMNSVGFLEIARDGMEIACTTDKCVSPKKIFKQVISPPLIAVVVGFVLVMAGVTLPEFLSSALSMAGSITSPLALMFVGMVLHRTGLSCIKKIDKGISLALVGRFLIAPVVMLGVAVCFGLPSFPTEVLVVQMGLPAIAASAIFAEALGADTEFAAKGVAVTTLLSFITIPIYIAMFGM